MHDASSQQRHHTATQMPPQATHCLPRVQQLEQPVHPQSHGERVLRKQSIDDGLERLQDVQAGSDGVLKENLTAHCCMHNRCEKMNANERMKEEQMCPFLANQVKTVINYGGGASE